MDVAMAVPATVNRIVEGTSLDDGIGRSLRPLVNDVSRWPRHKLLLLFATAEEIHFLNEYPYKQQQVYWTAFFP